MSSKKLRLLFLCVSGFDGPQRERHHCMVWRSSWKVSCLLSGLSKITHGLVYAFVCLCHVSMQSHELLFAFVSLCIIKITDCCILVYYKVCIQSLGLLLMFYITSQHFCSLFTTLLFSLHNTLSTTLFLFKVHIKFHNTLVFLWKSMLKMLSCTIFYLKIKIYTQKKKI